MSESDANRAMTDTARLRLLPDTREDTQRMTVVDRRYRQTEARTQHIQGFCADHPTGFIRHVADGKGGFTLVHEPWQWREPFERLPTTQTDIYERCYAAERVRREP